MRKVVIVVEPDGTTRHLVDAASERLTANIGPKLNTQRASHVNTWQDLSIPARNYITDKYPIHVTPGIVDMISLYDEGGTDLTNWFWADLLPVGGPVLGPFSTYAKAIDAEVIWLQDHNLTNVKPND